MLQINQVITTEFHVFVGTGGKFCFRGCKNAPDAAQWCNKASVKLQYTFKERALMG